MQEEQAYFKAIKNIQALDIAVVLHHSGCYVLPDKPTIKGLNFRNVLKIFATETSFSASFSERRFKKAFGFYGYNILKLLRSRKCEP